MAMAPGEEKVPQTSRNNNTIGWLGDVFDEHVHIHNDHLVGDALLQGNTVGDTWPRVKMATRSGGGSGGLGGMDFAGAAARG